MTLNEETLLDQLEASNNMVIDTYVKRISNLRREINKRDMQLAELEDELAIKDEIIRKLTIKMAE